MKVPDKESKGQSEWCGVTVALRASIFDLLEWELKLQPRFSLLAPEKKYWLFPQSAGTGKKNDFQECFLGLRKMAQPLRVVHADKTVIYIK